MISLERVRDLEEMRAIATMLDRENDRLRAKLQQLAAEVSRLSGKDAARLQLEIDQLTALVSQRERMLFGDRSEKRRREKSAGERVPQTGHGPREQPELPLQEVLHALPEPDRGCPVCGGTLEPMSGQTEDSEEITVIERCFVRVKNRRQKYRCRCNACVVTAPAPPKLQPGSRYAPAFAVEVAIAKYLDHLPLDRQVRIMAREGLRVDSQTLWDQIEALATVLEPSYQALFRQLLASPLVHADETWWRMMEKANKRRWWAWTLANPEAVAYRILDSRSQEAARSVLGDYRGIVMADGYGAYHALERAGPGFRLVHCWAHARRKFIEVEEHFPLECAEILKLIRELYALEDRVPVNGGEPSDEALALRARIRGEESRATVEKIRDWAFAQRALPESGLGKAIHYLLELWTGLTAFLEDPRIPLDNNLVERSLRGMVVGRKNHYGSRSKRGTEVAALFYSLIETAKLCGVEPKSYLLAATNAALAAPGTVTLPEPIAN